eukprot:sb/3477562/
MWKQLFQFSNPDFNARKLNSCKFLVISTKFLIKSLHLRLNSPLSIFQPIFTVEPSDIEAEEGHHVILECHVVSFPVATVTTNKNSLFRSRDWLSANQGPVFPGSVGS